MSIKASQDGGKFIPRFGPDKFAIWWLNISHDTAGVLLST